MDSTANPTIRLCPFGYDGDPGLADKIWGKEASGVKSPWLFVSLCVHVVCVAQPSPVLLASGGESSADGSGTVALEYRVGTVTAMPPPFQLPRATAASLAELAANATVSNEYGPCDHHFAKFSLFIAYLGRRRERHVQHQL
jgi:hypothetical protein